MISRRIPANAWSGLSGIGAGGPGQKKRRGGHLYPPRRFGAVCVSQGSGHGYLAISTYQIQPGLAPGRSLALTADKLGPRGSCLTLGSDFPELPPAPELPDVATLPAWLIHFLLFLTKGKTRPAMRIE